MERSPVGKETQSLKVHIVAPVTASKQARPNNQVAWRGCGARRAGRAWQVIALAAILTLVFFPGVARTVWAQAELNWQSREPIENTIVEPQTRVAQAFPTDVTNMATPSPGQRVRIFPRSSVPWQADSFVGPDGRERIIVLDSGVNILVEQVAGFDTVDIASDRIVIWTSADQTLDMDGAANQGDTPWEFYMEGNIVFRQQDRVIYADRMYYNVREQRGVVLDGELLTPLPGYEGLVRLKADVLRQVDPFRIEGFSGALTTSRMGVPTYWLQAGNFVYETLPTPGVSSTNFDPQTGLLRSDSTKRVTSRDNTVYLAEWPIFYWPFLRANLDRPTLYLESFSVNNDRVFGTQVLTEWNLYQLFGFRQPPSGTQWSLSADYLSDRGFGLGTHFEYDRMGFLNHPGPVTGFLDAWGINEQGLDNLGLGRRALAPETDLRGRVLGRHRQKFHNGIELKGEIGVISDRNFLEQYYEREWDQEKDQATAIELKQQVDNHAWSVNGDVRVNDFFTQTNWLPRGDHFWIAQPILSDWMTWTEHSSIGYGHLQVGVPPEDPSQAALWDPLAWEVDSQGVRGISRQRVDLPMQWAGAKIVPYALGEFGYWETDLTGSDATRLLGQLGVRASIPIVRVDPSVRNTLFNLNGLAHKVVFETEFFWADSDVPMDSFPLYDPLDDDAIEAFRRRFYFTTFNGVPGGNVDPRFDERYYALRSGLQRWVTSPSAEIADDLTALRLAARQRWQTKRGMPGQQRVVDWLTLDVDGMFYPDADRDNFGESFGLLNYDLRWHVGDRVTVLSDGFADLFADGLRTISLSAMVSRPGHVRYATGLRSIEGPISSTILYGSTSYRLSQKWIVTYGSSVDLGNTGNIGQRGEVVRIGESFLVALGANYDTSRNNFGVLLTVEPRFLAGRLGRVGGVPIPPVGVYGLE